MNAEDALDVTLKCVSQVGRVPVMKIDTSDVLDDVGITDDISLDVLKDKIVGGGNGVHSKGHTLKRAFLQSISTGSTVNDVADVVENHSVPSLS